MSSNLTPNQTSTCPVNKFKIQQSGKKILYLSNSETSQHQTILFLYGARTLTQMLILGRSEHIMASYTLPVPPQKTFSTLLASLSKTDHWVVC